MFRKLLPVVALLVSCAGLLGQDSRGSILGVVTDTSAAVVAGATVTAVNVATNIAIVATTNMEGRYEIPYLLPGTYRVTAEMSGFKATIRDGIEVSVNSRLTIDMRMELGAATESVTVTAETPLLENSTASIGTTMDGRRAAELPIVGGNTFYLARLSAGVMSVAGRGNGHNPFDQGSGTTTVIVNGTRSGSNEVMIDGVTNMSQRNNTFSPPQDLVQEYRIQTAGYDASLGHAAGAVINLSTKSGTNVLHGSGYMYDSRIKAMGWFADRWLYDPNTGPITPEKRASVAPNFMNQRVGFTLTGPVVIPGVYNGHNRTFFSLGAEPRVYERLMTNNTLTVPTLAERNGDFSALLAVGSQYQIYDPATISSAGNGRFNRLPLTGNIIPASRLDPIAKKIVTYWAEPNAEGTVDGRNNYFRVNASTRDWRSELGRIDHAFSEKHRIFGRVNSHHYDMTQAYNMPTIAMGDNSTRKGWGAVLDDVYVFNAGLLLNLRYGINLERNVLSRNSQGFDLTTLGFSSKLVDQIKATNDPAGMTFPAITVDGGSYTAIGADGGNTRATYYHTFSGTLTKITGGHSTRIGSEFRLMRENGYTYGNVSPSLEFAQAWTKGPTDNSTNAPIGQGLASMMMGYPTGGKVDINGSRAEQSTYTALFVQDDWRVSPRLTVNIGLRYEYESPVSERFNRSIRGFDFVAASPIQAQAVANYAKAPTAEVPAAQFSTLGGLLFAGVNGAPRYLWNPDRNNFAPRVGLAYALNRKTVFRAGYGILYDVIGVDRLAVNLGGFNQSTILNPSMNNGLTFTARLADPFPDGFVLPSGAAGGLRTLLGRAVSFFDSNMRTPYMQRWSATVQRELPRRVSAEVTYLGNRGTKLAATRQFDPVPAQYLSTLPYRDQPLIDRMTAQIPDPFYGIPEFAGTPLGNQNIGRSNLLRPYPQFNGITADESNGYSWYHSLQVQVDKRFDAGLTLKAAWTYSKFMNAIDYLNDTDPMPERVISDQDVPHRLAISGIYELPLGAKKPFFRNAKGWLNQIIGGWQFQGWYEAQTGRLPAFGNIIFNGNLHDIPLPVSERSAERWFNVDAGFERDSKKALGQNIRGLSTRFNNVRSDGINNFDLSLFKHFRIREGMRVRFSMEAFNALNHVQFANPNVAPANTAFGTVSGESGNGQRQVSFSAKILF